MVRKAFAVILLATSALAQMFKVENPDKRYNEVEAVKAYWLSVEVVRSEYHVKDPLNPSFTLIFDDKEGVWFDAKEIHLKSWDRPKFEQGVIYLALSQLATPENVIRLTKQIEAQQAAKVDVKDLKK